MTGTEPTPKVRSRWLTIALVVSLGLNLAVAGVLAGSAFKGGPEPSARSDGLWHYARALPDRHRRALLQALRESRGDWTIERRGFGDDRQDLMSAITAEPFDPGQVRAVLTRQQHRLSALGRRASDLLVAEIGNMTPEARRSYAEQLGRLPASSSYGRPDRRP